MRMISFRSYGNRLIISNPTSAIRLTCFTRLWPKTNLFYWKVHRVPCLMWIMEPIRMLHHQIQQQAERVPEAAFRRLPSPILLALQKHTAPVWVMDRFQRNSKMDQAINCAKMVRSSALQPDARDVADGSIWLL